MILKIFKQIKAWIILSFLVLSVSLPAPQAKAAFGITKDHPILKFCDAASTVGYALSVLPIPSMWPSIQVLPFPPFIAPGLVVGFSSRTSVIMEVCRLMYDIEALGTEGAIFASGRFLNELTGKKFDHHLEMADVTWNLANSVYDFENGEMRKGTLSSVSTHRDIADFMNTSYSWYNKTFNSKDARLKNRGEREQEMNQLASLSYRRAILSEATNCPSGYGNTNYEKVYSKDIKPWEVKRDEAQDDVHFYRGKLLEMGPRFMNDEKELNTYTEQIEDMMTQGVSYQVKYKDKIETSKKPHPTRKNRDGTTYLVDEQIKVKTQEWTVSLFSDVFEKFKKKWGPNWSSWVTAQFLSRGHEGLLDDPRGRVEEEFKELSYECNPSRLMRGVPSDRVDYEKLQEERTTKCKADVRMNQKKAENLLNYYAIQFQNSIYQLKQANANIWTQESWHLGTMRAVNSKDKTEGYQQEKVTCAAQNMEPAEMDKLKLKQQQVQTEYKEFISKQYLKKTVLMENEKKSEAEQAEELAKKRAFAEQQSKRSDKDLKNNTSPIPVEGGI